MLTAFYATSFAQAHSKTAKSLDENANRNCFACDKLGSRTTLVSVTGRTLLENRIPIRNHPLIFK